MILKKFGKSKIYCAVILLMILMPAAANAARVEIFGLGAEVPETWRVKESDGQIIIYNKTEDAAVIVDKVGGEAEKTAQTVAEDLADAVGIEKKQIRSGEGGLTIDFTHGGEPVNVRVFDSAGGVLMVYAFGTDAEVREIATSVGAENRQSRNGAKPTEK